MEAVAELPGMKVRVYGRWAQFRKPETNNNPLTHDFITKTALIGLMGAVLGIDRDAMRPLFPLLSDSLLYGVQVNTVVRKESWSFTLRNATKPNAPDGKAPRPMEFLRDPDFTVVVALGGEPSEQAHAVFYQFANAVQNSEACYPPVLGLHNCPAQLDWMGDDTFRTGEGTYSTKGFFPRSHRVDRAALDLRQLRLGFERVPTFQDANWWNPPARYIEVGYPSNGNVVTAIGSHYQSALGENWCLI